MEKTYTLKKFFRHPSYFIMDGQEVVGKALFDHQEGNWLVVNDVGKRVATATKKENIIFVFKIHKNRVPVPRMHPLCEYCPLHKVDTATRKQIRRKAVNKS